MFLSKFFSYLNQPEFVSVACISEPSLTECKVLGPMPRTHSKCSVNTSKWGQHALNREGRAPRQGLRVLPLAQLPAQAGSGLLVLFACQGAGEWVEQQERRGVMLLLSDPTWETHSFLQEPKRQQFPSLSR